MPHTQDLEIPLASVEPPRIRVASVEAPCDVKELDNHNVEPEKERQEEVQECNTIHFGPPGLSPNSIHPLKRSLWAVNDYFRTYNIVPDIDQALAHYELRNTNSQYLPTLDFYLTAGANSGATSLSRALDVGNNWYEMGYFGLTMNIPIFDGLYKSYRVQQTKIKIDQIENSFSYLQNQIDLQIRTSEITLENALRTLKAQEENMELSEEVYNVTKLKYQEGIGTQIEVINADATFKEAQNNYFQRLYDVLIAKVGLDKAVGILYME